MNAIYEKRRGQMFPKLAASQVARLEDDLAGARWPLERAPHMLETCIPGVFAVGDARSGSVKRIASGVGEGAMCIQLAHRVLAELA